MPELTPQQADFLTRFILPDLPAARSEPSPPAPDPANAAEPLRIWRDAKDAVDARLNTLRGQMLAHEIEEFAEFVQLGVFNIGKTETVAMVSALTDYARVSVDQRPAAARTIKKAARGFVSNVLKDDVVALLDDNPFKMDVKMRATLAGALKNIVSTLP